MEELIRDYTAGRVPDYQMSALLMAVVWRGLTPEELAALTDAMLDSGDRLRFDGFAQPRVDKHSTGGVGDKVSLLLAPMVASCGVAVPHDVRPGSGPHRRHTRQAGVDCRISYRPDPGRNPGADRAAGLCHDRADARDRSRRQAALRPARRDRHGGIDPADRGQHHVQEAGRGSERAGARREDRKWGVSSRAQARVWSWRRR